MSNWLSQFNVFTQIRRLKADKATLEMSLELAERERDSYAKQVTDLQGELIGSANAAIEKADESDTLRRELAFTDGQLKGANDIIASLSKSLNDADTQLMVYRNSLDSKTKMYDTLSENCAGLCEKINELEEELARSAGQAALATAANTVLESQVAGLQAELDALTKKESETWKKLTEAQAELINLKPKPRKPRGFRP